MTLDPAAPADRSCARRGYFFSHQPDSEPFVPDSRQAWTRLAVAVLIGSLGSVGMWSVVVALPAVQADFGVARGTASLAFTLVMLGFGSGGVLTGKITDRYGIVAAIGLGIGMLGLGYIGAGMSSSIWQFILVHFADRARLVGDLRAADGGSLALVRAATAASRSRSPPAAITSAARSGRRWSISACSRSAGAPPISRSACSRVVAMTLPLVAAARC